MTRPPFPLVWDDSMRRTLVTCPRKFFLEYIMGYRTPYEKIDLIAGGAWAKAMEAARIAYYVDNQTQEYAAQVALVALVQAYGTAECPPDNPKSLARMAEALVYYFDKFPFEHDDAQPYVGPNGPMIEFLFALPFDERLVHPESGEPLIYAGRSDMIATYASALTIYDDKTTKQLGPTWGNQWDLRSQFTGYLWAAQQHGIHATQVLVRGIAIYKSKIDHANALSHRTPYRVERWHEQVVRDIQRAMRCWEEGYWDYAEAEACANYGGCQFRQPCQVDHDEAYLQTYYVRKHWDPITRTEVPIEVVTETHDES